MSEDERHADIKKVLKASKKFSEFLKEKGSKFAKVASEKSMKFVEALQDNSLVAAEILKEKGAEFAEAASKKTEEIAKITGEKAAEFAKAASKKSSEFAESTTKKSSESRGNPAGFPWSRKKLRLFSLVSKATKEKTSQFAGTASKKTSEFAKVLGEKTAEFSKIAGEKAKKFAEASSKKTTEFARIAGKKTQEFAEETARDINIFAKASSKATKKFLKRTAEKTKDSALLLRPLKPREKFETSKLSEYLNENEYALAVGWLKQGKAKIEIKKYDWSFLVSGKNHFPRIVSEEQYTKDLNDKMRKSFLEHRFNEFAERAWNAVPQYIAPAVIGMLDAKQAISLQLFSQEPLHLLLIGDVGSGKIELFDSAKNLAEHTVLQASDGVCISLSDGRKVRPGAMARAGRNICLVNRFHALKKEDELVLYRTLETGYISYSTKSGRRRYDAPASVLAECSPRYGYYEKFDLENIKKQTTIDPYLIAKFHATIFTRKVNLEKFADIAEKIVTAHKVIVKQDDLDFIKRYAEFAKKLEVELPAHLADKIKEFAVSLKSRESSLPYKITPQTIVGIIRMAKASARMELRSQIESKDLERVFNIYSKITELR